jgi:hypothetical protein
MEQNRREFLKRSAVVGGAVWAAPAIATVGSAIAQTPGSVPCKCTNSACGLSAAGVLTTKCFGVGGTTAECTAVVPQSDVLKTVTVQADSVCGHLPTNGSCQAQACVANAVVNIGGAAGSTVTASSLQTCTSETSGTPCTECAQVNGLVCLNGTTNCVDTALRGSPFKCNEILFPGNGLLTIIANRQTCNADGTRTVDGLFITALQMNQTVTVASATAGCAGCVCTACAGCTTCLECGKTCTQGACTA